jgi:hypothetical protein
MSKLSDYGNKFPLSETTFSRWKVPAFHYRKLLVDDLLPVTGHHVSLFDAAFLSQVIGEFSDSSGFVEDSRL